MKNHSLESKARLYGVSSGETLRSAYSFALCLLFLGMLMGLSMLFSVPVRAEISVNKIVDAIYLAEGGEKAKKPYGILSVPCDSEASCRRIAENTVRNNFRRWLDAGAEGDYLEFLARRYAPIGASNDPRGLNQNWLSNVRYFMGVR